MNTDGTHKKTSDDARRLLHEAIATCGIIRASDQRPIVRTEHTGQRDPWLCDLRAVLLSGENLSAYATLFWDRYAAQYPFQVAGVETAGIPLVSAIAMEGARRGTPIQALYLRKSRKRNGLMKYIEGAPDGNPVIFVDDVINSGSSALKQINILKDAGLTVREVYAVVAYRAPESYASLGEYQVPVRSEFSLTDFGMKLVHDPLPIPERTILWKNSDAQPSFHLVVPHASPTVHANRVYFGCADGHMRCLDARTGHEMWRFKIGAHPTGKGILSAPLIEHGTLFFGGYDGVLYALDTETGSVRWKTTASEWIGSSPCIARDLNLVFVGLEHGLRGSRGGIGAYDASTGTLRWKHTHSQHTHASPLYIPTEQLVVIGSNDGTMYAYEPRTGALVWKYSSGGEIKMRATYIRSRRAIVFGSMDGGIYLLNAADGALMRRAEAGAGIYSTPAVTDALMFIASLDKNIYAFDLDLTPLWTFETGGRLFGSPVVHDDVLLIGSNDGVLYELDTATGSAQACTQLTERIVGSAAVTKDTAFVQTVADELYALRHS